MPPKRGRGRGTRGRGNESQQSAGAGRGHPPDAGRRDPEQDFPALGQQPGQGQPRQPRPEAQVYAPPARRGRTTEQAAEAARQLAPPQQQHLPQRQPVEAPSPVSDEPGLLELEQDISEMSLVPPRSGKKLSMAPRQPKGKAGRPINLIANYFVLQVKDISIYHYDIDITFVGKSVVEQGNTAKEAAQKKVSHLEHQQKRAPGKQRCRQVITQLVKNAKLSQFNPVYDGKKNLYTTKLLPMQDKEKNCTKLKIPIEEEGRTREFEVTIKPVNKKGGGNLISLEPLKEIYSGRGTDVPHDVIMAFDTVMCHRSPPYDQEQVGRSFFLISDKKDYLGEGIEIWYGYNQSVHLTQRGAAVLVNFAAKAFHQEGSIIDCACEILRTDVTKLPKLHPGQIKALETEFQKIKIEVIHQKHPRRYPVNGLTKTNAIEQRFKVDGNVEKSVADYFKENYKPLEFPNLPLLHMRTSKNTTFMPMEVCRIYQGQPKLGKLSGNITSQMIRKTAITPKERFDKIMDNAHLIERISGPLMRQFGMLMELKFMQLQGRVIGPPRLEYRPTERGAATSYPDIKGTWKMDGKQFFRSKAEPCSWMIVSFSNFCRLDSLEKFSDILCNCAHTLGMNLDRPSDIKICGRNVATYAALKRAKELRVAFAVVILSQRDPNHSYQEVKFLAEAKLNLLTQCMNDQVVVKKFNSQVATSVLLKINSKLGGVNHAVFQKPVIFSQPIIVIGADAAHSSRDFACPSIAAVVGSLDAFPSRYAVTCRVQKNPDENKLSQEIILDMEDMARDIFKAFLKSTHGKKPEKILFFRDGVSEGQYDIVLQNEVPAIQQACSKEFDGYVPPITFIVVQKRHQTRFRPQNPKDGVSRPGNVPPGTTVDTDIVHPVYFDFFLCSHEGNHGTSKPAHYTVLLDENELSSDELQKLCFHLCHMYVRCNKSISMPAPVMYADLACTRAKKYADWYLANHADSVSSASSGKPRTLPDDIVKNITDMSKFEYGMFYV